MSEVAKISSAEAGDIWACCQASARTRAANMPTESRALQSLFDAWQRLKELGWREAMYCPTDETPCELIECGSTGIHCGYRDNERRFWICDGAAQDIYPSTPVLYRLKQVRP